jgi:hypothetical protein
MHYLQQNLAAQPHDSECNLLFARALEQVNEIGDAVNVYRMFIQYDPACTTAYRGLSRLMMMLGKPALAAASISVLELLGKASPSDLRQLETLRREGDPPGKIDLADIAVDTDIKPIRELLLLVLPFLSQIFAMPLESPLEPAHRAYSAVQRIAQQLNLNAVRVGVTATDYAIVGIGEPITIHIHSRLIQVPDSPDFRFWVGRALYLAGSGGVLLQRLSNEALNQLLEALIDSRTSHPTILQLRKTLKNKLPRKIRKILEQYQLPQPPAPAAWNRFRSLEVQRADHLGLLISGNPSTALIEVAKQEDVINAPLSSARLRDLIQYSISEEYTKRYMALWTVRG